MRRWMLMLSKIAFFAADLLYFIISTRYKSCLAFSVQRFISPSRNEYLKWQWGWEKQKVRYDVVTTFRDHGSILICIYYNTWDKTWVRVRHYPLWSLNVNKEERRIWADVSSIKRQMYYHKWRSSPPTFPWFHAHLICCEQITSRLLEGSIPDKQVRE